MYEIRVESSAKRQLVKLPQEDFDRIFLRIRDLAENPRPTGCVKISGSINHWRIRVGSFRVVYEIDEKTKTLIVLRVKHRREAYR